MVSSGVDTMFELVKNFNSMELNIPIKLVINATLRPSSKCSILPSMLLASNANKPTTIPVKVPKIPTEVRRVGAYDVNSLCFPFLVQKIDKKSKPTMVTINISVIKIASIFPGVLKISCQSDKILSRTENERRNRF